MRAVHRRGRAFSLVEMLIALTITATLLTATLSALDASFRSYKVTTEGASTHVVAPRIVMHRVMTMIRTGNEFGPYPVDPLDADQNPVDSTFIEFQVNLDEDAGTWQVVRIERRDAETVQAGPYELWYVLTLFEGGDAVSVEERPLIQKIEDARFTLFYDEGPRLQKATVDIRVKPDDMQGDSIGAGMEAPAIRLVSSVSPRRLEEE